MDTLCTYPAIGNGVIAAISPPRAWRVSIIKDSGLSRNASRLMERRRSAPLPWMVLEIWSSKLLAHVARNRPIAKKSSTMEEKRMRGVRIRITIKVVHIVLRITIY